MGGKHGVKETGEAITGFCLLGGLAVKVFADGKVSLSDARAVGQALLDKGFREQVTAAIQGANKIPAELAELDGDDVAELVEVIKEEVAPVVLEVVATLAAAKSIEPVG